MNTREEAIVDLLTFLQSIERMVASGNQMVDANDKVLAALREHTEAVATARRWFMEYAAQSNRQRSHDPEQVGRFLEDIAKSLERLAKLLRQEMARLASGSIGYGLAMSKATEFREAFDDSYKDGLISTIRSIDDLAQYTDECEHSLRELESSIAQLPPLTPRLRRAIRDATAALRDTAVEYGKLKVRTAKARKRVLSRLTITSESTMDRVPVLSPTTTILFMTADPTDAARLHLGLESREIQDRLRSANLRDRFRFEQRMSVRVEDISQALLDLQPRIVHFSGHGMESGELCFENQTGRIHPVSPNALAALFEQFSRHVECVILNACYSETQAQAIAEHIAFVIGMNEAISDKAGVAYACGFYQALGSGRSVEEAHRLGCVQIQLRGNSDSDHLLPTLIKKARV